MNMQMILEAVAVFIGVAFTLALIPSTFSKNEKLTDLVGMTLAVVAGIWAHSFGIQMIEALGFWSFYALLLIPVSFWIVKVVERRRAHQEWRKVEIERVKKMRDLDLLSEEELARQGKTPEQIAFIRAYLSVLEIMRGE